MAMLKCRNCGKDYSSCNDAIKNTDYKAFCCSEECYKEYVHNVLLARGEIIEKPKQKDKLEMFDSKKKK